MTTTRISQLPMLLPAQIPAGVRSDGWSGIERALSDWRGSPEAATMTASVDDVDGIWRAMSESLGISAYAKAETSLKLISEAGRRASLTPRVIQRGVLARPPVPGPNRTARIETVDRMGSHWYALNPQATLQKHFVSREDLEAAGIVNTPKDSIGKPYPIILGEHSDHGALNVNGTTAEKGFVPVLDLGDLILTETGVIDTVNTNIVTVPAPINVTAEVVGSAGPETYAYSITAIFDGGETAGSNVAVVTSAPTVRDGSNYIHVAWEIPTGWEDYYRDNLIGYRICGRRTNPPTRHLDINRHALTGDGFPDWSTEAVSGEPLGREYNDDQDSDVEKEPGPSAVGTKTVVTTSPGDPQSITTSTVWGVMCWAFGYSEYHDLFASNVAEGAVPGRTLIDPDDPDLKTPQSANWTEADPWITVNGLRLSVFFVKGVRLKQHREGTVTFALNVCGATDTGDDLGAPISEASVGFAWILNQFAAQENWDGGSPWPLVTYSDGTEILDIAALDAFQAITATRIGGAGYQMHLYLGEVVTLSQFLQWFNTTFHTYSGQNDDEQYGVWTIDDGADPAAAPIYRQRMEIAGPLPEPEIAEDEVENRILFHYDWDPDARAWRGDVEKVEDTTSQTLYGVRDAVPSRPGDVNPGFLELRCTRDRTTARDAMARRLFHNKVAPVYQPFTTTLLGLEQGPGTLLRLTHEDGLGVAGYVARPFFVVRKRIGLNGPNHTVTFTARDVYRVYALGSGVMTDESAAAQMPFVLQ
jgi:hypothetical protein